MLPVLVSRLRTCVSTVRRDSESFTAMSAFVRPWAMPSARWQGSVNGNDASWGFESGTSRPRA